MNNIVSYFRIFYNDKEFCTCINWQTNSLFIEPKIETDIKSIQVNIKVPFIDYIVKFKDEKQVTLTSFGVFTWLQILEKVKQELLK